MNNYSLEPPLESNINKHILSQHTNSCFHFLYRLSILKSPPEVAQIYLAFISFAAQCADNNLIFITLRNYF